MPMRLNGSLSRVVLKRHRSNHSKARSITSLHSRHDRPRPSHTHPTAAQVCRRYASGSREVNHVAVLGGGITGLSAAHYITQEFPNAKVTLLERQPRLGGWLHSTQVATGDGKVTFESGPRSLRLQGANGAIMLRLIQSLDLTRDLQVTPRSSPAARNRYLYYPDSLIRLPGPGRIFDNIRTIFTEPAFKGFFRGLRKEMDAQVRPESLHDESIGSFITRRSNEAIANNLASALFHGIYAGDVWQLSMKTLLPMIWEQEKRHDGLLNAGAEAFRGKVWYFCDDLDTQMRVQETPLDKELADKVKNASVITFETGLGALSEALEGRLKEKRVSLRRGEVVTTLKQDRNGGFELRTKPSGSRLSKLLQVSHIISTLPPHALPSLLNIDITKTTMFPYTAERPARAANVAVVNFYFRTPNLLLKVSPPKMHPRHLRPSGLQGFGYLIPQSVSFHLNPERALGVIFDSDITPDIYNTSTAQPGTRLTVMLGGHYWDGWSELPSKSDCIEMARSILERHLGITEKPAAAVANVQRNCIPQYYVGHAERMRELQQALASGAAQTTADGESVTLGGRIRVAGSWYNGVGVTDCVRSAYDVVQGLKMDAAGRPGIALTGLERYSESGRPMAWCERRNGKFFVKKYDPVAKGRFPAIERLMLKEKQ